MLDGIQWCWATKLGIEKMSYEMWTLMPRSGKLLSDSIEHQEHEAVDIKQYQTTKISPSGSPGYPGGSPRGAPEALQQHPRGPPEKKKKKNEPKYDDNVVARF